MIASILSEVDFQFRNLVLSAPIHRRAPARSLQIGPRTFSREDLDNANHERVVKIDGLLSAELLGEVQRDVTAAFAGEIPWVSVRNQPEGGHRQAHVLQPMLVNEKLARLAFDPDILALVSYMVGRPAQLVDVDMRRLYPASMETLADGNDNIRKGYSNTCWHYDARGRQIKIQIYLTDVRPEDQNFAYLPGTGGGLKMTSLRFTRFSDEWAAGKPVTEIFGPAGTGMIFDTRIVHRVRRKPSRLRDSVTFYYHAGFLQRNPVVVSRALYASLPKHLSENLTPVDR